MSLGKLLQNRIVTALALLLLVSLSIVIAFEYAAESRVKLWLQGNSQVELSEITFAGQQREAICKSPIIISYLNAAAGKARRDSGPGAQASYKGMLQLGRLKTHLIWMSVAKDHSGLGIAIPHTLGMSNQDAEYWFIPFGNNEPKELTELLNFLLEKEFAGKTDDN